MMSTSDEMDNKIINYLRILSSLIIFINGFGFAYIGSKTQNKNWILEGFIYEIPWILLMILLYEASDDINAVILIIGLALIVASFIRAVLLNAKYRNCLDSGNYRKSTNRISSTLWVIISAIPIINGIGFIILGISENRKNLILEGFIYEIPWIIAFLYDNDSLLYISVGFALILISIMRAIMVNYESGRFSHDIVTLNSNNTSYESKTADLNRYENISSNNQYENYKIEINKLKELFDIKEKRTTDIIKERFDSTELTYEKFMTLISNIHKNFYYQSKSALDIIDLVSEPSEKIENEIIKKRDILKLIIENLDKLTNELILNTNKNQKAEEDLKYLLDEMDGLIDNIRYYE